MRKDEERRKRGGRSETVVEGIGLHLSHTRKKDNIPPCPTGTRSKQCSLCSCTMSSSRENLLRLWLSSGSFRHGFRMTISSLENRCSPDSDRRTTETDYLSPLSTAPGDHLPPGIICLRGSSGSLSAETNVLGGRDPSAVRISTRIGCTTSFEFVTRQRRNKRKDRDNGKEKEGYLTGV